MYLPLYTGDGQPIRPPGQLVKMLIPTNTHNPFVSEPSVTKETSATPISAQRAIFGYQKLKSIKIFEEMPGYAIGFRDFARTTDARSAYSPLCSGAGYGEHPSDFDFVSGVFI